AGLCTATVSAGGSSLCVEHAASAAPTAAARNTRSTVRTLNRDIWSPPGKSPPSGGGGIGLLHNRGGGGPPVPPRPRAGTPRGRGDDGRGTGRPRPRGGRSDAAPSDRDAAEHAERQPAGR